MIEVPVPSVYEPHALKLTILPTQNLFHESFFIRPLALAVLYVLPRAFDRLHPSYGGSGVFREREFNKLLKNEIFSLSPFLLWITHDCTPSAGSYTQAQ